jgi:hypothetical protein
VAEAEGGSSAQAERIASLDTSDFALEGVVSAHGGVTRKASA